MSEEEKVVQESEATEEVKEEVETHGEDAAEEAQTQEEKAEETSEEKKEDDIQDKYLRLMAEYQNFRNRTAKEKTALDILQVIDNFERAMAQKPEADPFADGMELILKQLLSVLEKNHIAEIEAEGKPFDPNYHNAVMAIDAPEGVEPNTVINVLQKGYVLNNKVIRAAMVAVSKDE
ncbi:MAG: nucleotide exchange factor GrpE [Clostridia bacterium]|nr:nucleotide exchange factor GrpE [Clostridia bacterium]